MDNVFIGLIYLILFALWLAAIVFWIISIIEVAKIPDPQFKAAGTDKIVWLLVVILLGVIGALIWRFVKRNDVLAAEGRSAPSAGGSPAAGWYPEPGAAGTLRYWDGTRWTEDRRPGS